MGVGRAFEAHPPSHGPGDSLDGLLPPIGASSRDRLVSSGVADRCTTGKTKFATPNAAWATLAKVVKHRHRKPKFWHRGKPGVYRCPFCSGYHTTSADRGEAA
jgi:hypothetical protein